MYAEQLKRIKIKIDQARKVDSELQVFGASTHKYQLGTPVTLAELLAFEERYGVELPPPYREFLLQVGNGGAGPYYGLYPLGRGVSELVETPEATLRLPARIAPGINEAEWQGLTHRLDHEPLSDEDYDQEVARLYSGIMPLGSQGCTYLHALVVSGEHAGRVVNLDAELNRPKFCHEEHFLDWYERWLDEIIGGILTGAGAEWFGYCLGGNDVELLALYDRAGDDQSKLDVLAGLGKLPAATPNSCERLANICAKEQGALLHAAARMLAKFDAARSEAVLTELLNGCDEDCKVACQAIFWYQKDSAEKWAPLVAARLNRVSAADTFRFMTSVLKEANYDYGALLIPFCRNASEEIRVTSFYALGALPNRENYIQSFIAGLQDEAPQVVRTTLQALAGLKRKELRPAYLGILQRFTTDEHSILSNLDQRLKEMGFHTRDAFINSMTGHSLCQKIKDFFAPRGKDT